MTAGSSARVVIELATDGSQFTPGLTQAKAKINELRPALAGVSREADKLGSILGGFQGMLAGAFSVGAIVAVGSKVLSFADELENLSAKTGVSAEGLQRLQLAFEPVGVGLDTVTRAASELSVRLVSGDKSAIAALDKLGLRADALKNMTLDQQLIKVGDAVGGIQNQAEKLYASKTLFGKSGLELLQGLDGHLEETTKSFDAMGLIIDEKTVKAADDFGDKLGLMGKQLLGLLANALGPTLPALSALADGLMAVAKVAGSILGATLKVATTAVLGLWYGLTELLGGLADLAQKVPLVGKQLGFLSGASEFLHNSAAKTLDMVIQLNAGTTKTGEAAKVATPPVIGLGKGLDEAAKSAQKFADSLAGVDLLKKANEWIQGIQKIGGISRLTHAELDTFQKDISAAVEKMRLMGQVVPTTWALIADSVANSKLLENTQKQIGESLKVMDQYVSQLVIIGKTIPGVFDMKPPSIDETNAGGVFGERVHRRVADQMSDLTQSIQNTVKLMNDSINGSFASMLLHAKSFKDGFLDIWQSIKAGMVQIFGEILASFVKNLLGGMLKGMAAARIGQSFGALLTGGAATAGSLLTAGAASAGTAAATSGLAADVASTLAVPGTSTAGGIGSSLVAFATNPYTLIAAGAVLGGLLLARHFNKGARANDARDKFLAQFAGFDTAADKQDTANPPGFHGTDRFLSKYKHHDWFVNLIAAKNPGDVKKAEQPIVGFGATLGRHLKSFAAGTPGLDFSNFGARRTVDLHGQEAVIPRGRGHVLAGEIAAALRSRLAMPVMMPAVAGLHVNRDELHIAPDHSSISATSEHQIYQSNKINVTIQALDPATFGQVFEKQFLPRLKQALKDNEHRLASTVHRATQHMPSSNRGNYLRADDVKRSALRPGKGGFRPNTL